MKKRFRTITAILLTVVLILVVIPFGTVSSSAAETANESVGVTQKAMFIMDTVNISQGMYEGTHQGSKAIDFTGRDGGIDPAYAPFDGKVVYISTSAAYIVYQSLNPVEFADGTVDYMTVWVIHDDDVGRFYVGQTFLQGQHFFNEGSSGYATGNHIHLECAKGTYQGQYKNDYGWYCLTNQINPYDALYLSETTTVINGYGYNWRRTNSSISGNEVDLGTNFYSIIKNNYRNTVLTGVEGNNVQSYSLFGSLAQWWKFENCGNNEYKITNCYYGKCLDVYCGLTNNSTNVDLYQSNDTDAQRWLIKESSTGFVIVPKCAPSLCVDLENVSAYDGTNIQIYSCNLNDAQIYSIPFRMQSPPCDLGNSFNSTILHTGSGKALG